MKSYRHIRPRDRKKIAKLKSYKLSISEIARRTGFNKSTISREIRRNGGLVKSDHRFWDKLFRDLDIEHDLSKRRGPNKHWSYIARYANNSSENRKKSKIKKHVPKEVDQWIVRRLKEDWSPQHIAGRSALECKRSISHEYVYQLIIKDKKSGGKLYRKLKRFGRRKQRLASREYKVQIPGRRSIWERPKIADERARLGDLEGDLIVGYKQSGYILTVIDRKARLVALEFLKNRQKEVVAQGFLKALKRMPEVRTLTLDNAREFSCHIDLTRRTGVEVYFADPYASHQRGSVENVNGWIRHYFPKRSDFANIKTQALKRVETLLNTRPRKVLGYLTPLECVRKNKEPHERGNRVALGS